MMRAGRVVAVLGLAALAGGMLFFGAIMAPLVFTKLPPEIAGPFIRAAFPRYYAFVAIADMLAGIGCALSRAPARAVLLLGLLLLTLWLWFWFMPHLDALRLAGDTAGFARGHRLSVWLNGLELLAAAGLLVRLVL